MKEYLTRKEAAEFLGVTVRTLKEWRRLEKGPVGKKTQYNRILYKREDLINFIEGKTG